MAKSVTHTNGENEKFGQYLDKVQQLTEQASKAIKRYRRQKDQVHVMPAHLKVGDTMRTLNKKMAEFNWDSML